MREEFRPGARNAVRVCLGIHEGDRVAMITTRDRADIGEAIEEESRDTGADVRSWTMEDWVERPATRFPRPLGEAIIDYRPTVSFYVGGGMPGELAFRKPMRELLNQELGCRHGHMIGITRELMLDGMAADYEEIYRRTRQVYEVVRSAARIDVRTRIGTELSATFNPGWRWIPSDGHYHERGSWGNLPEGEVFTAPRDIEGVLVGEELGDDFAEKYGLLEQPVRLHVKGSRVRSVEAGDPRIGAELEAYLSQHPESNRAGEFAIGTNVGLTKIVGNFLQDEKFPGVHVAFGDPYAHETGADWECPSHIDVLASRADVWVDGRQIMEDGRFLL